MPSPAIVDAVRRAFSLLPAVTTGDPAAMRRPGKPSSEASLPPSAAAVTMPPALIRWLNRATYGTTPELVAEVASLGTTDAERWEAWVEQQLVPESIPDPEIDVRITPASHPTLFKSLTQLWADHNVADMQRNQPIVETECAKLVRAVYSKRQLFEVMTDFWHDHFSTYGRHYDGQTVFVHYDRDVIRPNVFGNFRQMLGAVTRATTMMYFLDLRSNRRDGPNENFARELVELHTLGAEHYAGVLRPDDPSLPSGMAYDGIDVRLRYVDEDVYSATRALTGWSVRNGHWQYPDEDDGTFVFRPDWHDNYSKWVLDRFIQSYKGELDGELLLDTLAAHPGTAVHVCRKLCRRLVADDPPESLVQSASEVFGSNWQAPDQLARVVRHILLSNAFADTFDAKVTRPFVSVAHAMRVLHADFTPVYDSSSEWTVSEELFSRIEQTGHRPFGWAAPNGYPDHRNAWTSSGAMAMTWRLLSQLTVLRQSRDENAPYIADIVAQTQAALPVGQRSANAIVDYWIGRINGFVPSAQRRTVLVDFMRQNAAADAELDIDSNAWNSGNLAAHYVQSRLRHMVGLILCLPDFHRR